jgi:hypothetical protein
MRIRTRRTDAITWKPYCREHLELEHWIEDDQIWGWMLEEVPDA